MTLLNLIRTISRPHCTSNQFARCSFRMRRFSGNRPKPLVSVRGFLAGDKRLEDVLADGNCKVQDLQLREVLWESMLEGILRVPLDDLLQRCVGSKCVCVYIYIYIYIYILIIMYLYISWNAGNVRKKQHAFAWHIPAALSAWCL